MNSNAANSNKRTSYKAFLEPKFTQSQVNRQTYLRWMTHVKKGNTMLKHSVQNEQADETLKKFNLSLHSELNTTTMDVSSNENEDIGNLNETNENEDIKNINEIEHDDNCYEECDKDMCCNNEIDNDGFVFEDDFDLFENSDKNCDTNDDTIMFEAAGLSISQVFIMIQAFCLRYHQSDESRHGLLNLIKILAGPKFSYINTTKYTMSKKYNPPADKILYVFYCEQCYNLLLNPLSKRDMVENINATCSQCKKSYQISKKSSNYFLSIDVEYQIRTLLEDKNMREIVMNNLDNVNIRLKEANDISDVYDSLLYKDIAQNQKSIVLTFNFNTDGFPVFNSSKNSIWPVLLILNEIPPIYRFRTLILAGLWMSKSEPKADFMNLYLQIFIEQIEHLMNNGITILNSNNENITFVLRPFCASVDSVARPIMQNRYQFNGYFGCSWCYANGEHLYGSMRYPCTKNDLQRNHAKYLKDIQEVKRMQRSISGVKGPSTLTKLKTFDCVWGFPVEYMHGILLGVGRQMWTEWNSPSSPFYLSRKQRDNIDKRLLNIKPPKEIHRLPRSMKEGKLKASEWRSWILFYSVPCLTGILDDNALASFKLFVRSINILLSQHISEEDLRQCEIDLTRFVAETEMFYGKSAMTFNVHSLLHVVQSVRMSGPLWATSAFPYENGIFHLKQNVHGPNGLLFQIATKTLQKHIYQNIIINNKTETCELYCKGLFNPRKLVMHHNITECGAVLIGERMNLENVTNFVKKTISFENDEDTVQIFDRCVYKSIIFNSTLCKQPQRTNDTVIQLQSSAIVEISSFIYFKNKCYLIVTEYEVEPILNITHIMRVKNSRNALQMSKIVPLDAIKCKIVYVDVKDNIYVCIPPNVFEVQ